MKIEDLKKLRFSNEKRTPSDMSYDELRNLVQSIIDIYEDHH
jgi:hypothetical protein